MCGIIEENEVMWHTMTNVTYQRLHQYEYDKPDNKLDYPSPDLDVVVPDGGQCWSLVSSIH